MLAAFAAVCSLLLCTLLPAQELVVVPTPVELVAKPGAMELSAETVIYSRSSDGRSEALRAQAAVLAEELWLLTGMRLSHQLLASDASDPNDGIVLSLTPPDEEVDAEEELGGYQLFVDESSARIEATSTSGIAHGIATVLQLLETEGSVRLPAVMVRDAPRYPYRSIMIDVARRPHTIEVLEDVVRLAHLYKLRFLHLHLTDDQLFTFPFPPVTDHLENNKVFSRAELDGLVAYAEARGITIIPEIDLPGHSSRLRQSGYLPGAENDRDVASEEQFDRVAVMLNAVMDVFDSSPYFHIGGDESGAGNELVPFLARVQEIVRARGKRMIVWEGFHGAPTEALPPTGPDRVIVAAWESSYNAPWDLLNAGYEVINASWKPLYVVGGHNVVHPGSSGGRKWDPAEMAEWEVGAFWHWEPGRAVFEDRGPNDDDRDDQTWHASAIEREDQLIGSQISVWEQNETSVIADLRFRIPVFAERVWSGAVVPAAQLLEHVAQADARVFGIVQPVEVRVAQNDSPIAALFDSPPAGGVTLHNRTAIAGEMRYTLAPFQGSKEWLTWGLPADPVEEGAVYEKALTDLSSQAVRAQLVDSSGQAIPGTTWVRFQDWADLVQVQEYEMGARTPKVFPDFAELPETRNYRLPMLRGPITHTRVTAQRFHATLKAPGEGEFTISMKTQSGRARLWVDLNRDGEFDESEEVITETPNTEEPQLATITLDGGSYPMRVDHISGLPRPVVLVFLDGPGTDGRKEISRFLEPLDADPPAKPASPGK